MFEGAEPVPAQYTKLEEAYKIFDKFLEGQTWAAGDHLTIADLALVATVSSAEVSTNSFCSWSTGERMQRCFWQTGSELDTQGVSERWLNLCCYRFICIIFILLFWNVFVDYPIALSLLNLFLKTELPDDDHDDDGVSIFTNTK